ncbi:YcgJ family protein [Enterobacter hormaechei]|nr:YcgJ family protein [Enterobacter hormaechei]
MNKLMVMAVLLGVSAGALAADISSPDPGVVCDKKAGFCVDNQGIAMGLTGLYLGKAAEDKLQSTLGDDVNPSDLSEYTFSDHTHCVSKDRQCYKDRTPESKWTPKIFGPK